MKFDMDEIITKDTPLVISWPTGIIYSAQTGGMGCDHPECEGFLISLPDWLQEFDDCSYGCCHLWEMEDARIKLADALDEYFIKNRLNYIQIDRDRLKELAEGWWPVVYSKDLGDSFLKNGVHAGPFKGYIHTGNCD